MDPMSTTANAMLPAESINSVVEYRRHRSSRRISSEKRKAPTIHGRKVSAPPTACSRPDVECGGPGKSMGFNAARTCTAGRDQEGRYRRPRHSGGRHTLPQAKGRGHQSGTQREIGRGHPRAVRSQDVGAPGGFDRAELRLKDVHRQEHCPPGQSRDEHHHRRPTDQGDASQVDDGRAERRPRLRAIASHTVVTRPPKAVKSSAIRVLAGSPASPCPR